MVIMTDQKRKYDIAKLKEKFSVKILWSESSEIQGENLVFKGDEIEKLEVKLRRISSSIYGQGKGYFKTKFELYLGDGVFYHGRADIGDYDAAGIAIHIAKSYAYLRDVEKKDYSAHDHLVQFCFGHINDITDDELEELFYSEELEVIFN